MPPPITVIPAGGLGIGPGLGGLGGLGGPGAP